MRARSGSTSRGGDTYVLSEAVVHECHSPHHPEKSLKAPHFLTIGIIDYPQERDYSGSKNGFTCNLFLQSVTRASLHSHGFTLSSWGNTE